MEARAEIVAKANKLRAEWREQGGRAIREDQAGYPPWGELSEELREIYRNRADLIINMIIDDLFEIMPKDVN